MMLGQCAITVLLEHMLRFATTNNSCLVDDHVNQLLFITIGTGSCSIAKWNVVAVMIADSSFENVTF
jgi:hypothetical protein